MSFSLRSSTRRYAGHTTRRSIVGTVAGAITITGMLLAAVAVHATGTACPPGVKPKASTPLADKTSSSSCTPRTSHGFPLPDLACTPGAINPTVTVAVLQNGKFKTPCERDKASTKTAKNATYQEYGVNKPADNTGKKQTCELDHLVSLELGGADTVDNIWPQCGPADAVLAKRFFKMKDTVENYLAVQVRNESMGIDEAQRGIAKDWTQYLDAATEYWTAHAAKGFGRDE